MRSNSAASEAVHRKDDVMKHVVPVGAFTAVCISGLLVSACGEQDGGAVTTAKDMGEPVVQQASTASTQPAEADEYGLQDAAMNEPAEEQPMADAGNVQLASYATAPTAAAALTSAAHIAPQAEPVMQASSPAKPPASFAMCAVCHSVERDGPKKLGPNLNGVFGAQAGAQSGYNYSPAMRDVDVRWTRETLDQYLADPKVFVPGTKMLMPGMKDASKRNEIIDYLEART